MTSRDTFALLVPGTSSRVNRQARAGSHSASKIPGGTLPAKGCVPTSSSSLLVPFEPCVSTLSGRDTDPGLPDILKTDARPRATGVVVPARAYWNRRSKREEDHLDSQTLLPRLRYLLLSTPLPETCTCAFTPSFPSLTTTTLPLHSAPPSPPPPSP